MNIEELKAKVEAAFQEFNVAMAFHEAWKPAAYDKELHKRMGSSYATHTFNVVRWALRREMTLALMRLWDKDPRAVGMSAIAKAIDVSALAADRVGLSPWPGEEDQMTQDLSRIADEAKTIIDKYSPGGSQKSLFDKLKLLRDEHLAHRQVAFTPEKELEDNEIEEFYQDNMKLIAQLLGLVKATYYNPDDFIESPSRNANFFWASVCGERTEGHPEYKAPRS